MLGRTWLWAALVLPSLNRVHWYLGPIGMLAYATVCAIAVVSAPLIVARLPESSLRWLAVTTLVIVVAAFLVVYPIVNVHDPFHGSDDDDALNIGARALLAGESPYTHTTYLGNELHQFPGTFLLAAPFVLLGTSAIQNLVWVPLFFLAVRAETRDNRTTLQAAWLILALSPALLQQIVVGSSYPSNAITVLLGLWWMTRTTRLSIAAVAWGVALASRGNFLFLVPLAFGWLRQERGWKPAVQATLVTCAVSAALIVPFWLHDPAHFGPVEGAGRLLQFDVFVPYLGTAAMACMGLLAVALSVTKMDKAALFRNCAIVQAFPIAAAVLLDAVRYGRLELKWLEYGGFAAWFVFMALALAWSRPTAAIAVA